MGGCEAEAMVEMGVSRTERERVNMNDWRRVWVGEFRMRVWSWGVSIRRVGMMYVCFEEGERGGGRSGMDGSGSGDTGCCLRRGMRGGRADLGGEVVEGMMGVDLLLD